MNIWYGQCPEHATAISCWLKSHAGDLPACRRASPMCARFQARAMSELRLLPSLALAAGRPNLIETFRQQLVGIYPERSKEMTVLIHQQLTKRCGANIRRITEITTGVHLVPRQELHGRISFLDNLPSGYLIGEHLYRADIHETASQYQIHSSRRSWRVVPVAILGPHSVHGQSRL